MDAFDLAVGDRFPENRILSHDLLEGCYARAGLLTDVQVYEEYPSRYDEDVRRRYRWIRGDWQLVALAAAGRSRPRRAAQQEPAPRARADGSCSTTCAAASRPRRWSACCSSRGRALSPAWAMDPRRRGLPAAPRPDRVAPRPRAEAGRRARSPGISTASARSVGRQVAQALLTLACLPYEAFFSLDAVVRTIGADCSSHAGGSSSGRRRAITRASARAGLAGAWARMWIAPALAVAVGRVPVAGAGRPGLAAAAPLLLLWFAAPIDHLAHQPSADAARRAADGGPAPLSRRRRPQDLGLLRHVRRPGRSLAAAGQLPGVAGARGGASHVADQHGAGAARQSLGLRLRLHLGRPARRPHRARVPGDVGDGAASRPLLQLVRHPVARAARAALHLLGGQRQPGRPSPDAAARAARASRRSDPAGTRVRRAARHVRPRRRGHARARRRPP